MAEDPQVIRITKIIFDLLVVALAGIPILLFFTFGTTFQRGFYCDDESLRHPYHDSTVPSYVLYITGFGLNFIAMCGLRFMHREKGKQVRIAHVVLPLWVWNAYMDFVLFSFGAASTHLVTDTLKYTIGRLRPHFYTVCQPTFLNNTTCEKMGPTFHEYITDFTCTQKINPRKFKEMRLSFPSGHSSFSMYTMLYLAIYLQSKMSIREFKLLKHVLQYLPILFALWTGMTRVSDYKHHWSDVLAGFSIGAIGALLTSRYVASLFNEERSKKNEAISNGSNAIV